MTRLYHLFSIVCALACLTMTQAHAQNRSKSFAKNADPFGVISITGGVGGAFYYGDLNNKPVFKGLGPSISLGALYRITEHFSARGELRFYQVSGAQSNSKYFIDNLSFRTRNPDLSLGVQADLFPYSRQAIVNPYAVLGLTATYITPKTQYNGEWVSLAPLQTEGKKYSRLPLAVTGAGGINVRATDRLSLGLELNINYMFSDHLDDVGGLYPNNDLLSSDLAKALSDRSAEIGMDRKQEGWFRKQGKLNDLYAFLQLRATYTIGTKAQARERRNMRCAPVK